MSDAVAWLLSPSLGREHLSLLILCAVYARILGAQLSWRLDLARSWWGRALAQFARLVVHVCLPAAVLWRGALRAQMGIPTTYISRGPFSPVLYLLGLGEPADLLAIGRGVATGAAALAVLVVLWVWYARTVRVSRRAAKPVTAWAALREAGYLQLTWAFYRAVIGLAVRDPIHVALICLALVGIPWMLDPQRWHDLRGAKGQAVVQDWACAAVTAGASAWVGALWLMVVAHALWLWVGERVVARLSASPDERHALSSGSP